MLVYTSCAYAYGDKGDVMSKAEHEVHVTYDANSIDVKAQDDVAIVHIYINRLNNIQTVNVHARAHVTVQQEDCEY